MPYCPSCGSEISVEDDFCPKCGANILKFAEKKTAQFEHPYQLSPQKSLPPLYQRNYLIWFLLSYATGIFMFLYLYFIFDDLNKLDQYPKPKGVPSTAIEQNQLVMYFIFYFVFSFTFIGSFIMLYVIYHKKYSLLNNYLDAHPTKQDNNPIPTRKYIGLMILRDFLLISSMVFILLVTLLPVYDIAFFTFSASQMVLFGVSIGLGILFSTIAFGVGIYLIVQDFRWQEALNERIRILKPNAPMKDFF